MSEGLGPAMRTSEELADTTQTGEHSSLVKFLPLCQQLEKSITYGGAARGWEHGCYQGGEQKDVRCASMPFVEAQKGRSSPTCADTIF